jgi:hypothetical protein
MMYKRHEQHASLCVLSVNSAVLDLPGTVVSDRNASADFVRFAPAPGGLAIVDEALTFAAYWTHDDFYEQTRRKQAKQAEILVPDRVAPTFIRCAYVSCDAARDKLAALGVDYEIRRRPSLFFT